jgi:hypothetical protein
MKRLIGQLLLPILCCVTFVGAMAASIHLGKPKPAPDVGMPMVEIAPEQETINQAYPLYMADTQIGHCVLGIRTERLELEPGIGDPARVEMMGKIYQQASLLLRDVEDAQTACSEFASSVTSIAEIKESGYLPN